MIVLLVAPGLTVSASYVAGLVKTFAMKPNKSDEPPTLISMLTFAEPSSTSNEHHQQLCTEETVAGQCRFAIDSILAGPAHTQGSTCRIILVAAEGQHRLGTREEAALWLLFRTASSRFTAKSLILIGDHLLAGSRLDSLTFCSYHGSNQFDLVPPFGFVAAGCVKAYGETAKFVVSMEEHMLGAGQLDPELLSTDWCLENIDALHSTISNQVPWAILHPELSLWTGFKLDIGDYAATINKRWFVLLQVRPDSPGQIRIHIAPLVFAELCKKIAMKQYKVTSSSKSVITACTANVIQKPKPNPFTDTTISLSGWTASQPQPSRSSSIPASPAATTNDQVKDRNKQTLKKLLLLSLRHVGVEKGHPEFMSIWKHLYCGCLFALRRDLAAVPIEQSTMLAVIKNNINFLNISR